MEVHPPEHGIHSWRDFLVHMGTITLGLLIAIGLEQSVEWLHHRHQRHLLLESLRRDNEQQIVDSERVDKAMQGGLAWTVERMAQVREALDTHKPLAPPLPCRPPSYDLPDSPSFLAAKSSGMLPLLSQQEITAYAEAASVAEGSEKAYWVYIDSTRRLLNFQMEFSRGPSPQTSQQDFSKATPEDLHRYLELLTDTYTAATEFDFWAVSVHGAAEALLHGERDLKKIQEAERQPITWTGTP